MKPTPITPEEAKQRLDRGDRIVFVDARNPTAWGSSDVKLPGALRIPLDDVQSHVSEIPRDGATTVTYCT
jgi:rhodanese-related sulfurtransferase